MIFTGDQLILKRSFYTQTGNYGFAMNATVDNTTGVYHFGLSGAGAQSIDFRLESGHLYWGNTFLHAYAPYQAFSIEGQFTSGAANIIKDGAALVYGAPKTTGSYNYFYFTRQTTTMGGTFDLEVSGNNTPVYSITQSGYLTSSGQNAVTGWFANRGDYAINVFDSTMQASAIYDFGKLAANVGARNSGAFAYTGDYSSIDFSQPILTTFATSFGDAVVQFSIVDARSFQFFVQLTGPTDFTFNAANILNRDLSYLNYSGGVVTNGYDSHLNFSLGYISGSGSFTVQSSYTVPGYGQFRQSGILTGAISTVTGVIVVNAFSWATGAATGLFSGFGTGYATGIGYSGFATGYVTGRATGFIFDGSGTLNLFYPLNGGAFGAVGAITPTGSIFATGYIDISSLVDGDSFSIIVPNGSDYTLSPLARLSCNYLPLDPSDCQTANPIIASTDFPTPSDLIACISGFSEIGLNGISDGGDIIYFTSTLAGTQGNGIAFTGNGTSAILPGTGYTTGGSDGVAPIGLSVLASGAYTTASAITLTGSGVYVGGLSGQYYQPYVKTFSGSWSLATGGSPTALMPVPLITQSLYTGGGIFAPNSYINFQVNYSPVGPADGALLIISGDGVINPIYQPLSQGN